MALEAIPTLLILTGYALLSADKEHIAAMSDSSPEKHI